MKKKYFLFALLLALPFVGWAVGGDEPKTVTTEDELKEALKETAVTEIQLGADITLNESVVIPESKTVTLDLNGKSLTKEGGAPIQVNTNGNLTIKDSSDPQTGLVKGKFAVSPVNGSSSSPAERNATITIEGGNFESSEFTVLTGYTTGNTINIKGGKFTATDNAVLATNGVTGCGGNIWNISGGEFNGSIITNGYNAFAIYAANEDEWNISGGTFNVTNGAGIVQRGGVVNVSGGTFNCTGTTEGKYGDGATGPAAALYFDAAASYPGLTETTALNITGGSFSSDAKNVVVTEAAQVQAKGVEISGGTFSDESAVDYLADGLSLSEDGEVVETTSLYTWTLGKTVATYVGQAIDPAITVKDEEGEAVRNYVVKVFTDEEGTEEVEEGLLHAGTYYVNVFDEEGTVLGDGNAKKFVINKNTVEIVLQQIYLPYGSALSTLEPVYVLKTDKDDKTPTDQIVIENLGKVAKGSNWAVGEEGETLEPDNVRNYTTLGKPKAFVGRTYDEEGNLVEAGFEDYIATTNTSSANIVATKGTLYLDIDADDLMKIFGFADPEYTFTAKSQDGLGVDDVTVTREDKGTVKGEAVGQHPLTVNYNKDHYDLVIGDNGATLVITPFDLTKDNAEDEGYGSAIEDYTELFEIQEVEVEYNGNTQYPDPVITFHHAELGDIVLSDFDKWETVGVGKKYTTDDYWYLKAALHGNYNGDYDNQRNVARNEETAEVEAQATIRVHAVEGEGKNFVGEKTQTWKINPVELQLQVAKQEASYGYAIEYALETVDPSDVVEADANKKPAILEAVAEAIKAANGFVRAPEGEGVGTYTVTVSEEAQAEKDVILAAPNYTLVFVDNADNLVITPAKLTIIALNQTIAYPEPVDGVYSKPEADTEVKVLPADQDEETGYTVKVIGYIPDGKTAKDLVELSCEETAVGVHKEAIILTPKSGAQNLDITLVNGDLTIGQLNEIQLGYTNVSQALDDHKGKAYTESGEKDGDDIKVKVFLPARKMVADDWYAWVLPFEVKQREVFTDEIWGYGALETLDEDKTNETDVTFNLRVIAPVEANTPFIVKIDNDIDAEKMAQISFADVVIDDQLDYLNENPTSGSESTVQFIGTYEKTEALDATTRVLRRYPTADQPLEFWSGKGVQLPQTQAYLQFPTEAAAEAARIYIQEADGSVTAINGVVANEAKAAEGWYTVNGVKLDVAPTQKGVYIKDGKKVVVK